MRQAGSSGDPMVMKVLSYYKTAVIDNLSTTLNPMKEELRIEQLLYEIAGVQLCFKLLYS